MQLCDHELFHQQLAAPEQLVQQLQQLCPCLPALAAECPAAVPARQRQKATRQLQRQCREVLRDAQALVRLVGEQQQAMGGQDPLSADTAAGISMAVLGLGDDAIDEGDGVAAAAAAAADELNAVLAGLSPQAEQQLRRVFAVTDALTHAQVSQERGGRRKVLLVTQQTCCHHGYSWPQASSCLVGCDEVMCQHLL